MTVYYVNSRDPLINVLLDSIKLKELRHMSQLFNVTELKTKVHKNKKSVLYLTCALYYHH